jgi:plastocyanin
LHRTRNTVLAIAALSAGLALSACGRDDADLVKGKTLFVQRCGSCHVLARANTKGIQGPSLDAAFGDDRKVGINEQTVRGVVKHQIGYPRRSSIMPAKLVKGSEADDVAAYVAFVAGQPGKDQGELANAGQPKTSGKPAIAKGGTITIDAIEGTAYSTTAAQAPPGKITFDMPNKSSIQHNIALQDNGVDQKGKIVGKGQTSTISVDVKPGKYTFYCSVPGHEEAGMKGTLTVK